MYGSDAGQPARSPYTKKCFVHVDADRVRAHCTGHMIEVWQLVSGIYMDVPLGSQTAGKKLSTTNHMCGMYIFNKVVNSC